MLIDRSHWIGISRLGILLRAVGFVSIAVLISVRPSAAQDGCNFERCGLAISHGPIELVQSAERIRLGRSFWGPDLDVLLAADEEIAGAARTFQKLNAGRHAVRVVSAAGVGGLYAMLRDEPEDLYLAIIITAGVSTALQHWLESRGLNELSRAVWLFNSGLANR